MTQIPIHIILKNPIICISHFIHFISGHRHHRCGMTPIVFRHTDDTSYPTYPLIHHSEESSISFRHHTLTPIPGILYAALPPIPYPPPILRHHLPHLMTYLLFLYPLPIYLRYLLHTSFRRIPSPIGLLHRKTQIPPILILKKIPYMYFLKISPYVFPKPPLLYFPYCTKMH